MSSSDAARRRSGDPRTRAGAASSPQPRAGRRLPVVLALAVALALVTLAVVAARSDQPGTTGPRQSDGVAPLAAQPLMHAEVACDLSDKAEQAAEDADVAKRARFAASVLLLDHAIIESARAAESEPRLGDLDAALQAVHTAGHEGDDAAWQDSLSRAKAECRTVLGEG